MRIRHLSAGMIVSFFLTLLWGTPAQSRNNAPLPPTLIRIKGSDMLETVANAWSQAYQKQNPDITIAISGGGSSNGIAALINGHTEIASASRNLLKREERIFTRKFDAPPHVVTVGLDAISILVHKDNPLKGISFSQLTRLYGDDLPPNNWSDLGVTVPGCPSGEIIRVSQKTTAGTNVFLQKSLFEDREHFHYSTIIRPTPDEVIRHVAQTPCAIGYSGMIFVDDSVKALCVTKDTAASTKGIEGKEREEEKEKEKEKEKEEEECVPPTTAFTLDRTYPLTHPLLLITLGNPQGHIKDFLSFVLGKEGQYLLRRAGFVPLPRQE